MAIDRNSVAVITGAGSGIGKALALRLSEEGVRGLVLSDVNPKNLETTAGLVSKTATKTRSIVADVAKLVDVEKLRDFARSEFGEISHLFNNAGVGLVGRTEEVSYEDMEWLFGINFWGTVYGTKTFLPVFREQGFGHIINISSVFGLISPPGQSTYCASKFAVRGFTESLRHELDGTEIKVSCVHPGGVRTSIVKHAKQGENAPDEDMKLAPVIFDKIARTTPETAAATIIDGVKSGSPRILIGSDAMQISAIQRLFPKRYFKLLDRISGGTLSKFR